MKLPENKIAEKIAKEAEARGCVITLIFENHAHSVHWYGPGKKSELFYKRCPECDQPFDPLYRGNGIFEEICWQCSKEICEHRKATSRT